MKSLYITFTDREFNEISRIKKNLIGKHSWHLLILKAIRKFNKLKGGKKDGNNKK